MKVNAGICGILAAIMFSVVACGKDKKEAGAPDPEVAKAEAMAAEIQRKNNALEGLYSEQQFLDLKVKVAGEKLEKQGNKTKKRLKSKFVAFQTERGRLAENLSMLATLPEPGFSTESEGIRGSQDSLSIALSAFEKSMK